MLEYKIAEFKKQIAAGVPLRLARMLDRFRTARRPRIRTYGQVWDDAARRVASRHAQRRPHSAMGKRNWPVEAGFYADIVAVPGNPLNDITVVDV